MTRPARKLAIRTLRSLKKARKCAHLYDNLYFPKKGYCCKIKDKINGSATHRVWTNQTCVNCRKWTDTKQVNLMGFL